MAIASSAERYMLGLINAERIAIGLAPLILEQSLNASAEAHSEWMLATDIFSHTGDGGSSASDRMQNAGFDFSGSWRSAENIAVQSERGVSGITDDIDDLHNNLMNSAGHRANILNPDLTYIGIGIEVGSFDYGARTLESVIVTQNFASTEGHVQRDLGVNSVIAPPPIAGSTAADQLNGTSGSDIILGYGGNDRIVGLAGADTITAGYGADRVYAGAGNDRVDLGAGNDFVSVATGNDSFNGGLGTDTISYFTSTTGIGLNLNNGGTSEGAQGDTVRGFEHATGSNFGGDRLYGTAVSNTLKGYGGDDTLYGKAGADKLFGGNGQDRLDGDGGADQLFGGAGADVFHFDRGDGNDRILDFQDDIDTIQLDNFGFASKAQALAAARQAGSDVIFEFGTNGSLRIEDVAKADLTDDLILL